MAELHLHWQLNDGPHDVRITDAAPAVIGRLAENDVPLLFDERVSRRHALVRRRGEGFMVSDLTEGKNPIVLNNARITTETLLSTGDVLTLGGTALTVGEIKGVAPMNGPTLTLTWTHAGKTYTETIRGGDPATIGRDETATVQVEEETVSRAHVQISERGGRFAISDLTQGRNPVRMNDVLLSSERYLNAGDVIRLGRGDVEVCVVAVNSDMAHAIPQGVRLVTCVTCHRRVDAAASYLPLVRHLARCRLYAAVTAAVPALQHGYRSIGTAIDVHADAMYRERGSACP